MLARSKLNSCIRLALGLSFSATFSTSHMANAAENPAAIEEIRVIGITPGSARGVDINRIPFAIPELAIK